MRLTSALAAATLLAASLVAHADTITQTYSFNSFQGYSREAGTSFAQFNSALGTLDSVSLSFSSTATFSGGGDRDKNHAQYSLHFNSPSGLEVFTAQANGTGNGTATARLDNYTLSSDNNFFTGKGSIATEVRLTNEAGTSANISSTFGTETVTYNYSPAAQPVAATPEPSSIVLLGSGLLGVAGIVRRRLA